VTARAPVAFNEARVGLTPMRITRIAFVTTALLILLVACGSGSGDEPDPTPTVPAQPTAPAMTPAAPTPSPSPTVEAPMIYIVESGDTGLEIAAGFGIALADLAEANDMTEAELDHLQIGQELRIPR
jgi:LysM repeat protein